jgi:Flp pilus assembly protein TadD
MQKPSASISQLQQAVQNNPNSAKLQTNLGVLLHRADDLPGAVRCFQKALTLDPGSHAAYNNLGTLFASLGDRPTALTFFQAALALRPEAADIHNNIANILLAQGHTQAAVESYSRAIALMPDTAAYHSHLGNALRSQGRYAEAEAALEKAISLHPANADAHINLGFLCYERHRSREAEEHYRRAIQIDPESAKAHTSLGHLLLRRGDFAAGWIEQEWRWRLKDFPSPPRNLSQPQWRGEELTGTRLLLHAEQGFGDTIQLLRYLPLLACRGATILVEVHPELLTLTAGLAGISLLIARGDPLPPFDWHCPFMSLPLAFATTLETIPATVPYLHSRLPTWIWPESQNHNLRVGLAWAGNPQNHVDRRRSLSLSQLLALAALKHVSFYSLQRGPASDEVNTTPFPFTGQLPPTGNFATTAAVLASLDLVVTVDTAVAHLAGALGKPVWILLPNLSDWRWLTDREDSPWYPTARLFRQTNAGDWQSVIDEVVSQLASSEPVLSLSGVSQIATS